LDALEKQHPLRDSGPSVGTNIVQPISLGRSYMKPCEFHEKSIFCVLRSWCVVRYASCVSVNCF